MQRSKQLTLMLCSLAILTGCVSYENEVSKLSDRELCFEWMSYADMHYKAKISQREIVAVRGITCSEIYGQSLVNQMKDANNLAAIRQAEAKRVQAEANRVQRNQRIAARAAIASRQKEEAASTIRLVSKDYETYYGRNNERKRRTLCEYSDGRVVEYSQSSCPQTIGN